MKKRDRCLKVYDIYIRDGFGMKLFTEWKIIERSIRKILP